MNWDRLLDRATWGVIVAAVIYLVVQVGWGIQSGRLLPDSDIPPYAYCQEDEVFTWVGDFKHDWTQERWQCVPLDLVR